MNSKNFKTKTHFFFLLMKKEKQKNLMFGNYRVYIIHQI